MYKYLIFLLQLIFISCASNKARHNEEATLLHLPQEHSEGYFENHFEIENIVPIETADSLLISDIKKIIKAKDKILLLSKGNCSVFVINSHTGKIETSICKRGNGPGESNAIIDILYDEASEHILIYNDYNKLLVFDMQGKYLSEVNVGKNMYENVTCDEGNIIFYSKISGHTCYPYMFRVYNLDNRMWKETDNDYSINFPVRARGLQMVKSKQVWFTAPLDFKIYRFENNENPVEASYQLDIPISDLNDDLIKKTISNPVEFLMEVSTKKIIYSINSVRETANYLVFRSNHDDFFILDKVENKLHNDKFILQKTFYISPSDYYPHEGDDDSILFVVPAERWMNKNTTSIKAGLPAKWQEVVEALNVNEDDNPILFFFKEKQTK